LGLAQKEIVGTAGLKVAIGVSDGSPIRGSRVGKLDSFDSVGSGSHLEKNLSHYTQTPCEQGVVLIMTAPEVRSALILA
jgi:hypothetical protein